jgi:DNA cross-link repair 1A protein
VPLCKVNVQGLEALAKQYKGRYSTVVGFQPTGWTHQKEATSAKCGRRMQRGTVILHQVGRGGAAARRPAVPGACAGEGRPRPRRTRADVPHGLLLLQVPYSEHSSFAELQEFVHWFRPVEIIPSVSNDRGPKLERMLAALRQPPQQRVSGYFVTAGVAGAAGGGTH